MTGKKSVLCLLGLLALALLPVLHGCSPSKELSGTPVPNALPDTRVTGQPPTLRETDFIVRFFWSGTDPDGRVKGYQWKLSNNGLDGISLRDTLTIDPATGDTLNPWHFTVSTDTIFIVKADRNGFPGDSGLGLTDQRAFETHSLFVRAVDMEGGVDPTPAIVSFTATTLVPTIIIDRPRLGTYDVARSGPPTMTFGWTGSDPDFVTGVPVKVRYLWKPALFAGQYIVSRDAFNRHVEDVCSFADSAWSDWFPYAAKPEDRTRSLQGQRLDALGRIIYYIFAVQAQDTAGARSVERTYSRTVHNLSVVYDKTPLLSLAETYLGTVEATGQDRAFDFDIAQNQPLNYAWSGTAEGYAGIVVGYRYGWDVTDPTDENDPGWAIQVGNTPQHRRAPVRQFQSGVHTLTVQCFDNSGQMTMLQVRLSVVPVPLPGDQKPLLLVDDVRDRTSQAWPSVGGTALDNDIYRDAFWVEVLADAGGVAGFDPVGDVIDTEIYQNFGYREIVNYRNLIWANKKAAGNYVNAKFDPDKELREKYVWLNNYQLQVGNVFMCGQQALQSFIGNRGMVTALTSEGDTAQAAPWMAPIIFDAEEEYQLFQNTNYALGFGWRKTPDGTLTRIGRERYPYLAWGIAALDAPSTPFYVWPGVPLNGSLARKAACVGLKAIVLDPAFKAAYVDPGALADTIYGARNIDWKDYTPAPTPANPYPAFNDTVSFAWGLDEIYDTNITQRPTAIIKQRLSDGRLAMEPMWRQYSRFDWVDDTHALRGDPGWPYFYPDGVTPYWNETSLAKVCGKYGLNLQTRSVTGGAVVGLISRKFESTKPGGNPDVVWGFDPYRFDKVKIKQAIRWVLRDEFGMNLTSQ
ncbi:MAG: hypothetical protein ACYDIE_05310 [Candidatus Krumholzibacteriia bacterium]